jgi:hypothetical protein
MRVPRALIAAFLLVEFVWWKAFAPAPMEYYLRFEDHETRVAGGSHPVAIVFSLAGILLYVWLLGARIDVQATSKAPLWRRFGTFVIDFYFVGSTILWLTGLIAILVESGRAGAFQWHFQREYGVKLDGLFGLPLGLVSMALIFLYFAYPLTKAKQTVGCYLLRIGTFSQSAPDKLTAMSPGDAAKRIVFEFRGLCARWKLWRGKPNGQTWYDEKTDVIVLRY